MNSMVIFHSYVSLPEGKQPKEVTFQFEMVPLEIMLKL